MAEHAEPRGRRAVLIAGPTASGKSMLAMELAHEFGGVVVNADSMQVYAELRILTNRPTAEDENALPHRLYGFRPATAAYSTGLWLADVERALDEADELGCLPIIVGGTGLYFKALTEGLSAIPDIPAEIRDHYREKARSLPSHALHDELTRRDPLTASRLRPSDPQRLARALEVLEATGRPLAEWQERKAPPLLTLLRCYALTVDVPRKELYRRCDTRFDAMIANGALDEVRALAEMNLDPCLPAMRAVGVPPLLAYLAGELPFEMAAVIGKANTRNYVKRQITWIYRNFISWNRFSTEHIERTKSEINIYFQNCLTIGC